LVFVGIIAVMYVAVAALGNWKPKLGLDLQGGTRITLEAKAIGGSVTSDKMSQAVDIINQRVNGAGVANSEVTTQGSNIITVEIPGKVTNQLARSIGKVAQLRFRLVAATLGPPLGIKLPGTQSSQVGNKITPVKLAVTSGAGSFQWSATGLPAGLTLSPLSGEITGTPKYAGTYTVTVNVQDAAQNSGSATFTWKVADANGTVPPPKSYTTEAPTTLQSPNLENIPDPYKWAANPPSDWMQKLREFTCPGPGQPASERQLDVRDQPLLACDEGGTAANGQKIAPARYLLSPAVVDGTTITNAAAGIPQNQIAYAVTLSFNGTGARDFLKATQATAKSNPSSPLSGRAIAIVLDGKVVSAPVNDDPIPGGQAIITGPSTNPFTQSQATTLANALKFGALPLTFVLQDVQTQGPELASGQLDAGIYAGIVGLILVVIYCLLYYRGLSFVVVSSLAIAGSITYACVLLLGHSYGFTLTLPEIAGLIVAIGITADSFIVYFERLRDEVRDGKTLRTSVETGWRRARMTIVAADAVSFLAALILFIFAIGDVKGFAFALGLTTLIDIFVVYFFTKPVVTLLARTKFFGQGHKFSGLDRQHLGMPPLKPKTRTPSAAGGEA
jgi:preprotein translocase subunit SecD